MSKIQQTKVKICGIKSTRDIKILNKYLPDFAGFVLAKSRRQVSSSALSELISALDKRIVPVGVFVNEEHSKILQAIDCGLKIVQLHGDEDAEYVDELQKKIGKDVLIWKACRIGQNLSPDVNQLPKNISAVLLDKFSSKKFGGLGETFDWELAKSLNFPYPLVLAGGLNVNNVSDGIKTLQPWAVDVSSGVEENGVKSERLVREFVEEVREKR